MSKPAIQNKKLIEGVGERNGFLPATIERLTKIALWNSGVSMALVLAIAAVYIFQPTPNSYAVSPDGKVIKMTPLTEGVGAEAVSEFVSRTVMSSYSLDFLNWETQLGNLSPAFTEAGYSTYLKAVEPLKNRIVEGRFITSVGMSSPPIIVKSAAIDGVMKYRVRVGIVIGFEGQSKRIAPQQWEVDVVVERVPNSRSHNGLAVSSIVAKQSGSN